MYYCTYTIYKYDGSEYKEIQNGEIFVIVSDYVEAIRSVNGVVSAMYHTTETELTHSKFFTIQVGFVHKCDIRRYTEKLDSGFKIKHYKRGDVFYKNIKNTDDDKEIKNEMKLEQISEAKVLENLAKGIKVFRMKLDDYSIINLEEKSIKTIKQDMESETKYLYFALFE